MQFITFNKCSAGLLQLVLSQVSGGIAREIHTSPNLNC